MLKKGLFVFVLLLAVIAVLALSFRKQIPTVYLQSTDVKEEPRTVDLHFEDVQLFWKVYDSLANANTPKKQKKIIRQGIMRNGSIGLKQLHRKDKATVNRYWKLMLNRTFFNSIRPFAENYEQKNKEEIYLAFEKMKAVYPDCVFKDYYFVMSLGMHGGTVVPVGSIIELEKYGLGRGVDYSRMSSSFKKSSFPSDDLIPVIIHENVHINQPSTSDRSLQTKVIREGAADFITFLVLGEIPSIYNKTYAYGRANEADLWRKFEAEMLGTNSKDWLYNFSSAEYPDLGYFMGYQICEAYYEQAEDKQQAIWDIINRTDFADFYKESGYAEKFK